MLIILQTYSDTSVTRYTCQFMTLKMSILLNINILYILFYNWNISEHFCIVSIDTSNMLSQLKKIYTYFFFFGNIVTHRQTKYLAYNASNHIIYHNSVFRFIARESANAVPTIRNVLFSSPHLGNHKGQPRPRCAMAGVRCNCVRHAILSAPYIFAYAIVSGAMQKNVRWTCAWLYM